MRGAERMGGKVFRLSAGAEDSIWVKPAPPYIATLWNRVGRVVALLDARPRRGMDNCPAPPVRSVGLLASAKNQPLRAIAVWRRRGYRHPREQRREQRPKTPGRTMLCASTCWRPGS